MCRGSKKLSSEEFHRIHAIANQLEKMRYLMIMIQSDILLCLCDEYWESDQLGMYSLNLSRVLSKNTSGDSSTV